MHICTFLNKIRIFLKNFFRQASSADTKLHINYKLFAQLQQNSCKLVAGNANVTLINMHLSIFHSLCINRIEWNRNSLYCLYWKIARQMEHAN